MMQLESMNAHQKTENKIDQASKGVDFQTLHLPGVNDAGGPQEFLETDDIGQRGILKDDDRLGDEGRDHVAHGLRQNDVTHGLGIGESCRIGGLLLSFGDGLDSGADDFGEIGGLEDDEGHRGGNKIAQGSAGDDGNEKIEPENDE